MNTEENNSSHHEEEEDSPFMQMVYSLILVVAGGAVIYLSYFENYVFAYRRLVLPTILVYVIGGICLVGGVVWCVASLKDLLSGKKK